MSKMCDNVWDCMNLCQVRTNMNEWFGLELDILMQYLKNNKS
jgi:hypothetical protein